MSDASEFQPVRVTRIEPTGDELVELTVDLAGTELRATHTVPGQYVQVRVGDLEPAYLSMTSAPGAPRFEFLVKRGGESADALAALEPGDEVQITAARGEGYRIDDFPGADLLLFAGGSGIAPLRSLVRHVLADRDRFGQLALFYGARRPASFGFQLELDEWREAGIDVHQVVSQPDEAGDWPGETGYVQDVLARVDPSLDDCVACLCGVKDMLQAVSEALQSRGLAEERILTNF